MTDALDRALQRANRAELDTQIGPGAFATYVDALDELNHSATQNILEWWRNQPPEVVDAMLDTLRDRDAPHTVKKTEAETGRTGLALLEELIALGLAESGLTGYEDEITQRLAPPPTHAEPHTSDALDHALRQANPAKLDRQIGPQAFTAYTNAVAIAKGAYDRTLRLQTEHPRGFNYRFNLPAATAYNKAVDIANNNVARHILKWWRNQPPEVVDAMLDALLVHEGAEKAKDETNLAGIDLLEELVILDLHGSQPTGYRDEIARRLDAARTR